MSASFFARPILNSPYRPPALHHALDKDGQPTGAPPIAGRRRSELITPVPKSRKKQPAAQAALLLPDTQDLSTADQEYNPTPIINEIRNYVAAWRALPNPADWGVTPATQRLLTHWRSHAFQSQRPFFCQVEAAETLIWLTEVSRRDKRHEKFRLHLEAANAQANPGLSRIAMKMATGSGKTTVMAMLIAWQTVNAVRTPASALYSRGFLIVAPGITIKDRLRVLQPNDPDSYYRARELVPADMLPDIDRAKIVITNYHAFKPRETLEISRTGRLLLQGRNAPPIATLESDGQMLHRVAGALLGFKGITILNDEAHHCYREKPGTDATDGTDPEERAKARNKEAARLWISRPASRAENSRPHRHRRPLRHPLLPARLRLRGGHSLPLDRHRFLSVGRNREWHRQVQSAQSLPAPATNALGSTATCETSSPSQCPGPRPDNGR